MKRAGDWLSRAAHAPNLPGDKLYSRSPARLIILLIRPYTCTARYLTTSITICTCICNSEKGEKKLLSLPQDSWQIHTLYHTLHQKCVFSLDEEEGGRQCRNGGLIKYHAGKHLLFRKQWRHSSCVINRRRLLSDGISSRWDPVDAVNTSCW